MANGFGFTRTPKLLPLKGICVGFPWEDLGCVKGTSPPSPPHPPAPDPCKCEQRLARAGPGGLGFRDEGVRLRVSGLGIRVTGFRFRVSVFRVRDWRFRFLVGSECCFEVYR